MRDRRLGHCPRCKLSLQATPHVPNSVSQIHSYVSIPSPTPPFLAGTLTFSSSTPPMNPVFPTDVPHLSSDPVPGLLVSTTLVLPTGKRVTMQALVDSGASACFMDAEYARQHQVETVPRHHPIKLEVIDGRDIASGTVTHESISIPTLVSSHLPSIVKYNIVSCPSYPIILGIPWLALLNPTIDWTQRQIRNSSPSSSPCPHGRIVYLPCSSCGWRLPDDASNVTNPWPPGIP